MRPAVRVGLFGVLVAALVVTTSFFLRRPPSVRYAGVSGNIAATVQLRLSGPAPSQVTIDLGNGTRLVAARLP